MNILLITHSFAPLNKVSSLRMVHWVKYWLNEGHSVTVLTTKKYPFDGECSLDLGFESSSLNIIEVDYLNFSLKKKPVKFKGAQKSLNFGLLRRLNQIIRKYIGSLFDIHDLWVGPALNVGNKLLREQHFDLMVSSFGPPCSHVLAARLRKKNHVKWIADYRDLWSDNHIGSAKFPFSMLERRLENKTVRVFADSIITVSTTLAKKLNQSLSRDVAVIENGFDPEEYENIRSDASYFIDPEVRNIVYAGNIYPGRRDPIKLLETIKKYELKYVVHFFGPDNVELAKLEKKFPEIMKVHGAIPRRNILNVMAAADILLLLESCDSDADGVLTGKLFEYFAIGKPVLGIGFDESVLLGRVLSQSLAGESFNNDCEAIYHYLRGFDAIHFNPDKSFIKQFNRRDQARRVLGI